MKNNKGFTLIELLVVIAIIGLLSTMAVVSLNGAREKSRDARRISDIKQIQTALELYYDEADRYPIVSGTIVLGSESYDTLSLNNGFNSSTGGIVYMGVVPSAPTPADGTTCNNGNNNSYQYTSSDGSTYTLSYCLGSETGGVADGVNIATPAGITQ